MCMAAREGHDKIAQARRDWRTARRALAETRKRYTFTSSAEIVALARGDRQERSRTSSPAEAALRSCSAADVPARFLTDAVGRRPAPLLAWHHVSPGLVAARFEGARTRLGLDLVPSALLRGTMDV